MDELLRIGDEVRYLGQNGIVRNILTIRDDRLTPPMNTVASGYLVEIDGKLVACHRFTVYKRVDR